MFFIENKKRNKINNGFTLVEMMVSVAIFSIIMVVGIGALVSIMDKYQVSQQEKEASDSLNFVLETITREMRLGTDYWREPSSELSSPPENPSARDGEARTDNGNLIGFNASDGRGYIIYSINNGVLYRQRDFGVLEPLTDSSQVLIKEARFRVMNAGDPDDLKQPLVWMQLLAYPPGRDESIKVIQTLVSQRLLDA